MVRFVYVFCVSKMLILKFPQMIMIPFLCANKERKLSNSSKKDATVCGNLF